MSSEEIIEKIIRYGQFLERALGKREDQQVLVVLEKLDRLPISLDNLQETGIGKTVNGYRKCSDPVGMKAKSIVNKWKGLVQAAMAEDQSQQSESSPIQTDDESEHVSHGNATDDDSLDNSSPVVHKKEERSAYRGRLSEMEAYNSKVKRKFESNRDEKASKKPCDNQDGLEQIAFVRSVKSVAQDTVHRLKEPLLYNGLSKESKGSDISKKGDSSCQSQLNSSGKGLASTSSRGSSHGSSYKGHKSESHKSGSSSHSNRDVSHRHKSSLKDGKNSVMGSNSACKSTDTVSNSEVLPQIVTTIEAQSPEQDQGSDDLPGQKQRNLELQNNLKRKTKDSGYSDMPKKKQLLEFETTDLLTSATDDYRRSALAKQSGHRDYSPHRDPTSKTDSSSHKNFTLSKDDSQMFVSTEKYASQGKSSLDKSSLNKSASTSKDSVSGRHSSHRESTGENALLKESSARASSHKELSSKHVSHKDKDLSSKTSPVKESSTKHSSQKQSSSLSPMLKESGRNVHSERLSSLEEPFSESFSEGSVMKSGSLGKPTGNIVRNNLKAVDGSLRAEIDQAERKTAALPLSALDLDEEASSCGMSFEEMLNYDTSSSKTGLKTTPTSNKTPADFSEALKKDGGGIAKAYSGSQSLVLSSSKKTDRSSKSAESNRVNRKDYSKANSSHHCKLDSSSNTEQDKSSSSYPEGSGSKEHFKSNEPSLQKLENSGKHEYSKSSSSKTKSESRSSKEHSKSRRNHNKPESYSSKEHNISGSSHFKLESNVIKEHSMSSSSQNKSESSSKSQSKLSSSFHEKPESNNVKEPSSSGRRPESNKKQSRDDSKDKNSQFVEQRKETKELGYKVSTSATEKVLSFADDSDADSDDADNGKSFEDFLNYKGSTSQIKSSAKSSKPYAAGSKVKTEKKLFDSTVDCADELSLSHPLINVPLPKQEELNLGLDSDGLPLYPFMRQEFQVKKNNVEKLVNLERRYGQKMIYSGKKQAAVPTAMTSLFAACMQVLQENIDDITYVGGIPADILKPVLELCSVSQLEKLEFYNPQFVGDTEELWKLHCQRDFRGHEPEELESWRELYLRLQNARNRKLALISQSVMANKKRAEKDVPRIQLTYVDHVCTGRRTIKKLAAVRTASAAAVSDETSQPRSKQEILDSLKNQISKPMIRRRGGGYRPEVTSVSKPAAPLMQKTLKFLKGMKR